MGYIGDVMNNLQIVIFDNNMSGLRASLSFEWSKANIVSRFFVFVYIYIL